MLKSLVTLLPEPEAKGTPDTLDFKGASQKIQSPLLEFVSPIHAQSLCFWGDEQTYDHVELDYGQSVRLKTKGDSPFIGKIYVMLAGV